MYLWPASLPSDSSSVLAHSVVAWLPLFFQTVPVFQVIQVWLASRLSDSVLVLFHSGCGLRLFPLLPLTLPCCALPLFPLHAFCFTQFEACFFFLCSCTRSVSHRLCPASLPSDSARVLFRTGCVLPLFPMILHAFCFTQVVACLSSKSSVSLRLYVACLYSL